MDRMEQWSRYVRATGIDELFVGEEWEDYLSTQVYYGVVSCASLAVPAPARLLKLCASARPTEAAPTQPKCSHCPQPLPRVLELWPRASRGLQKPPPPDHRLWPSRYYAAARGQEATLDKLLSEGGNPDWFNPQDGLTPLQIAALKGRAACVYRLLVAGAPKILSNPSPN